MPDQPEAFCEQVATLLRRMCPERQVELTGVFEMRINGRHLALENLYRMVQHDPERGVQIVEEYLDHLLEGESAALATMPLELVQPRIMPRIQPESIFQHLDRELVVHEPFVNDTVVLYVIDMPHLTVSITVEQMLKWGLGIEEIGKLARRNLREYSPQLHVKLIESETGGRAAIVAEQDGYDASRLLLDNLFNKLSPAMGGDFFVATPSRDTFLALTIDPPDLASRLHDRIVEDYKRLPYPITERFFVVTRDGVAGTAAA